MTGLLRPAFRPAPLVLFGLLAAAIMAAEYAVVHHADFGQRPALPPAAPGLLNAARLLLTPPNLLLTLAGPQRVRGLYGRHRLVRRLAIYVDEPAALGQQLVAASLAA